MWEFGLLLILPAIFDGISSESPPLPGCVLPDGRFMAVGERWAEPMGDGMSCGDNCVCEGVNIVGCNGCPVSVNRPRLETPPLTRKSKSTVRERREIGITCQYNGKTYSEGDSFASDDGCNRCFCTSSGEVGCTLRMCIQGCSWKGVFLSVGETYLDECAVCRCLPKNKISCKVDACHVPPPPKDGINIDGINRDRESGQHERQSIIDIYEPDVPAL